jgi:hypothetical protein
MNSSAPTDNRWYQVMTNLLYPAVLGTILYAFGDEAWKQGVRLFTTFRIEPLLALALVVLFTLDYAYTLNDNAQGNYGAWQFSLDCVTLGLLFLAGKAILAVPSQSWLSLPVLLLAVKLLAVLYEISRLPRTGVSDMVAKAWKNYESDAYLLIAYLSIVSIWLLTPRWWPQLLAIGMFVDAIFYLRKIK